MKIDELAGHSIVVLGMGIEGCGTLRFLLSTFPGKTIGIADRLPFDRLQPDLRALVDAHPHVNVHCGESYLSSVANYDVIVKSAGISINVLRERNVLRETHVLLSHTTLFFDYCRGTIIGVSGTKGKSTTSSLIFTILKRANKNVRLIGNIGISALDCLRDDQPDSIYVYELSSYQLETLQKGPHISVLLNIMPEHLDYHGGFSAYADAKLNLIRFQCENDFLIYNQDCPQLSQKIHNVCRAHKISFSLQSKHFPGYSIAGDAIVEWVDADRENVIASTGDVPLIGSFNLYNALAAVSTARIVNVSSDVIREALRTFTPLEHRIEPVGVYRGVLFYNDSISTVPQCTMAAMNALGENVKTIILGGHDRGVDYTELGEFLAAKSLKNVILFPSTGPKIWNLMKKANPAIVETTRCLETTTMREAVSFAYEHTAPGEICLLSPAASSYEFFKNFKERGRYYKQYVKEIGESGEVDEMIQNPMNK
ncbi:MAG: UDP-N-acetylmuramoyl-L-alanine--D-glutamate ligase [Candidatus Omnitrophota bacterium]|jgi:UDP-N-acetylmuramoylalanine--D-glutamate ligase|nr:MAG: UDP-N-acetylmuramoyl-L-alanine--D-glutamate ligase [Candidatus Omnitrophota bacterium]